MISLLAGNKARVNSYVMLFRKDVASGMQYKSLQPLHRTRFCFTLSVFVAKTEALLSLFMTPGLPDEKVVPRSFVLTDEQVLLCDEEVCNSVAHGKTQLVCESAHALSDLNSVELDTKAPLGVKLVFEKEGWDKQSEPWELVCQSPLAKEHLLKHLRAAWRAIFKLDLTVTQRNQQ